MSIDLGQSDTSPVAAQVSQAIRTGLPLESGLIALAEQSRSRRTRQALIELSESLKRGVPLVDAIRESNVGLPRTMGALVEAGMETGRLDSVMQYCVEQSQRAAWLRQQIWMSLAYPMFLMWFALVICGAILLTIVPQFKKIFDDFGTELPGLTVVLIQFSDFVWHYGWIPLLLFLLVTMGVTLVAFAFGDTNFGQRWSTSIPFIGSIFRLATMAEFCQILAVLTESKLPFPKSLRFASQATDDRWLGRQIEHLARDIEAGSSPESAASLSELPNSLRQVFRHARSEGIIADALRGLSEVYSARCSVGSRLISTTLEPFAVVLVMGFAGTTALAMFMPLIKLLNDLS